LDKTDGRQQQGGQSGKAVHGMGPLTGMSV
jgi:hypothetical protein